MSRRSNAPIFWLLFGAGGMLAALFGTALVFITGIAAPLGWAPGRLLADHGRMLALAQHPLAALALWAVVSLFAWHAMHRIVHSLHDLGLRMGPGSRWACYGLAGAITLLSLSFLGALVAGAP